MYFNPLSVFFPLSWLIKVYGEPILANTTLAFRGMQGIMFLDVSNEGEGCRVLLWDGMGFHQNQGFIHHKDLKQVYLWETPNGRC